MFSRLSSAWPVAAPDAACLIARGGVRQLYFAAIEGRRFVMMAGVGFDARVVDAVASSGFPGFLARATASTSMA